MSEDLAIPIFADDGWDMSASEWDDDAPSIADIAEDHAATGDRHLRLVEDPFGDGLSGPERVEKLLAEESLSEAQLRAVMHNEGPLLVVAGAGAGKTKTMITRVARLVASGTATPGEVLTITFTNKVAREVQKRLRAAVGVDMASSIPAYTFHALAAKIVRSHSSLIGRSQRYTIVSAEDAAKIISRYMTSRDKALADDGGAKWVHQQISFAKNEMLSPQQYYERAPDQQRAMVVRMWEEYENELLRSDSLDFDDLLTSVLTIWREHPEILSAYQRRFRFVQVDEYQDTNRVQYQMLMMLAASHRNLVAVGDHRQSIYRFRGADVSNIRGFSRDFHEAEIVELRTNYRSTPQIVSAANRLISHAADRILDDEGMDPFEGNADGPEVHVHEARDVGNRPADQVEGEWIAEQIKAQIDRGKSPDKIAVICRTRKPLYNLAKPLGSLGIPHRMLTGHGFYERGEVRAALAHLQVLVNPKEEQNFAYALQERKGVGPDTISRIVAYAQGQRIDCLQAGALVHQLTGIQRPAKDAVELFSRQMLALRRELGTRSISSLLRDALHAPGGMIEQQKAKEIEAARRAQGGGEPRGDYEQRLRSLNDIVEVAAHYERTAEKPSILDFLNNISLADSDDINDVDDSERVVLATLHGCKGLEWDTVIVMGMEEGTFPSSFVETEEDHQEELRCAYVALTRARRVLVLSYARTRWKKPRMPSRYIQMALQR